MPVRTLVSPPIAQVNRQLRQEILPFHYGLNRFFVDLPGRATQSGRGGGEKDENRAWRAFRRSLQAVAEAGHLHHAGDLAFVIRPRVDTYCRYGCLQYGYSHETFAVIFQDRAKPLVLLRPLFAMGPEYNPPRPRGPPSPPATLAAARYAVQITMESFSRPHKYSDMCVQVVKQLEELAKVLFVVGMQCPGLDQYLVASWAPFLQHIHLPS